MQNLLMISSNFWKFNFAFYYQAYRFVEESDVKALKSQWRIEIFCKE